MACFFFAGTMQLLKAIVEWRRESALGEYNSEENIVKDKKKRKSWVIRNKGADEMDSPDPHKLSVSASIRRTREEKC